MGSEREFLSTPKRGKITTEVRYFISSPPPKVKETAYAVHTLWSIETGYHWKLDMVFQEDQSPVRKDHGSANLATIHRWLLSILRQDTSHNTASRPAGSKPPGTLTAC